MVSVESKLNIFREELAQKINSDRKVRIEEAKKAADEEILKSEERLAKREAQLQERFAKQGKRKVSKIISEGNVEARRSVFEAQDKILKDFQKLVLKTAENYVSTPAYKTYLEGSLSELSGFLGRSGEITIQGRDSDLDLLKTLVQKALPGFKVKYASLSVKDIGGFRVSADDGRVSYDFTVRSLIDDNKRQIAHALMDALKG